MNLKLFILLVLLTSSTIVAKVDKGTAHFKNLYYLPPGGTGGAKITKEDLTAKEIPLSVRQVMQKDGARNIDVPVYMDLLPIPLLYNVIFD